MIWVRRIKIKECALCQGLEFDPVPGEILDKVHRPASPFSGYHIRPLFFRLFKEGVRVRRLKTKMRHGRIRQTETRNDEYLDLNIFFPEDEHLYLPVEREELPREFVRD